MNLRMAVNPAGAVNAVRVAIETNGESSRLTNLQDGATIDVTVAVVADTVVAKQWLATFRHVHRVELLMTASSWSAVIDGIGHRLPIKRRLPVAAALGMGVLGIPIFTRDHTRWE